MTSTTPGCQQLRLASPGAARWPVDGRPGRVRVTVRRPHGTGRPPRLGERIAEFGRRNGVPELQYAGVDLPGFGDPRRAAEAIAFVGMGVLGAPGYIGESAGPETQVYFAPDDPQIPHAKLDSIAMPRFLTTGAGLFGHSARQVVSGCFAHHGVTVEAGADRIGARLPDGSATEITFDALGRIAAINSTLG